jgi:hypothetical protein
MFNSPAIGKTSFLQCFFRKALLSSLVPFPLDDDALRIDALLCPMSRTDERANLLRHPPLTTAGRASGRERSGRGELVENQSGAVSRFLSRSMFFLIHPDKVLLPMP